jgi:hypothetical protein
MTEQRPQIFDLRSQYFLLLILVAQQATTSEEERRDENPLTASYVD